MQCLKIYSLCKGKGRHLLCPSLTLPPTYKLYILRHCINIVYLWLSSPKLYMDRDLKVDL